MLNFPIFIYLVAHVVPAAIGFVALSVYTRLLSPAEYGAYTVGLSAAGIAAAVFFAWVRNSVSRYQASSTEIDFRATAAIAYGGTTAVIAVLVPVVLYFFGAKIDGWLFAATLAMAMSLSAFEISQEFQRATQKPLRFAAVAALRSALGIALGWLAITMGFGGIGLLMAVAASFLLTVLLNADYNPRKWLAPIRRDLLMRFIRYGLPLTLGGLAFALYTASDRLMVAYVMGQEAAGQFGVAADFSRQLVVILAASVASAAFPVVFRTFASEGAAMARLRLGENIELLLAIVVPIAVGLAIAAEPIARAVVGPEFRATMVMLLPFLAAARLLGAINQFYLQISFQLAEKPILSVTQEVAILILNTALMLPLVSQFGLIGAGIATLITEATGLAVGIGLSRYAFPLPFEFGRIGRVLGATVLMAAAAYLAKSHAAGSSLLQLVEVTVVGGIAYVVAAWIFDVVRLRTSMSAQLRLRTAV